MFSKKCLLFLIFLVIFNYSNGQGCDNRYILLEATEGLYKLQGEAKTWLEAKTICHAEGAKLFYPENQREADEVINYINQTHPDWKTIYVGISYKTKEDDFISIDGSSIKDDSLRNLNLTNANGHCVQLLMDGTKQFADCKVELQYVCKKIISETALSSNVPEEDASREQPLFRNDYTYLKQTQSFYKAHTLRKSWLQAKKLCAREGATLYYPEDKKESDVLLDFIKKTQGFWSIFIGISDLLAEGAYETVDGRSIADVYHIWRKMEPNNVNGIEHCVEQFSDGTLNDLHCNDPKNFVCKKTLSSLKWNKDCNLPNQDYSFNEQLRHCYKIHTAPMKWSEAHAVCVAEQSYLAVINSQDEADYLVRLFAQAPRKPGYSKKKAYLLLGFHNQFNEEWTTVRGAPLDDSGYSKWLEDQSGYNLEAKKCGSMYYESGLLNAIDCEEQRYFICEHEVAASHSTNKTITDESITRLTYQ